MDKSDALEVTKNCQCTLNSNGNSYCPLPSGKKDMNDLINFYNQDLHTLNRFNYQLYNKGLYCYNEVYGKTNFIGADECIKESAGYYDCLIVSEKVRTSSTVNKIGSFLLFFVLWFIL